MDRDRAFNELFKFITQYLSTVKIIYLCYIDFSLYYIVLNQAALEQDRLILELISGGMVDM